MCAHAYIYTHTYVYNKNNKVKRGYQRERDWREGSWEEWGRKDGGSGVILF